MRNQTVGKIFITIKLCLINEMFINTYDIADAKTLHYTCTDQITIYYYR